MHRPPPPAAVPAPARPELPRHVAIIMDGNGRWARRRHRPRISGHRAGVDAIRPVCEELHRLGVHILTVYAFSTENWSRPRAEVAALMRLFQETIEGEIEEMAEEGIQVRMLGDRSKLSASLQAAVAGAEARTAHNTRAILNVAINYGGRSEIVNAVRHLAEQGADLRCLDEAQLARELYTQGLPDPDLVIRTAGELRISNFLIWQSAYAELHVTETLWPDFGHDELRVALDEYSRRIRKFGGVHDHGEAALDPVADPGPAGHLSTPAPTR